jgi:hypothetical protein
LPLPLPLLLLLTLPPLPPLLLSPVFHVETVV